MDITLETLTQEYAEAAAELANIQRMSRQVRAEYKACMELYRRLLEESGAAVPSLGERV